MDLANDTNVPVPPQLFHDHQLPSGSEEQHRCLRAEMENREVGSHPCP